MVIHIYGITLNTGQSPDQNYSYIHIESKRTTSMEDVST